MRQPYNRMPWEIGRLSLPQVMNILLPKDQGLVRAIVPIRPDGAGQGLSIITDLNKSKGRAVMNLHEKMKVVHKLRYALFDDVCDHLRKTPEQLLKMDMGQLALAMVEVSGRRNPEGKRLTIEKFPPDKLRRRTAEYVASKKRP